MKKGDRVTWNTSQGKTSGKIVGKVTGTAHIKGHTAKASQAEPQYKVETDSGKTAIHHEEALHKE